MEFDLNALREVVRPFVQLFSALLVSGVGTSIATQLLKMNWFPLAVSKYPRIASAVISVLATVVTVYLADVNIILHGALDYVAFALGTLVLSAVIYQNVLKGTLPAKEGNSVEVLSSNKK